MRFLEHTPPPDVAGVRAAWREFIEQPDGQPRDVRPHIARAWKRSAQQRCNPYLPRADLLSPKETIALLQQEKRLIDIAMPFMAALSRAAGKDRHAAMLSDGSGRLLKVVGDPETVADDNFPRAGSLLSEATAGANGVGTAIGEGGYVELVGPEHFIEGFHVFTCQGVPLQGPDNRPLGVLSTSVRRLEAANKLRDILFCASESAECELLSSWLTERLIPTNALAESALESLRQDMVQRIAMARLQLELAAKKIAAGTEATTTIRSAQQLCEKFRRQAAIWRNMIDDEPASPEPIALADLVGDMVDLLGTEARVANVALVWKRDERFLVRDDIRALTRRLLEAFLSAMQIAARPGEIAISLSRNQYEGRVCVSSTSSAGKRQDYVIRTSILK